MAKDSAAWARRGDDASTLELALSAPASSELAIGPGAVPVAAASNFQTIQVLRAIAALLVVIYHGFDTWAFRVNPATPGLSWANGAAGVDIFFVISGFVMVVSTRRLPSLPRAGSIFMRHRIVRIVPLYWLLTTAKAVLVFLFADLVVRSSLDLDYVVRSYLFFPVLDSAGHFRPLLPVGWTLTYEFLFYILFALALALRIDVLRVIVPAFALSVALAVLRTDNWPQWTILFNTIVVEFAFGVVLARMTLRGQPLPPAAAAGLVVVSLALIMIIPERSDLLRPLTWGVPAFGVVAGAVSLETHIAPVLPRGLLALGDASYSIYLTHGFLLPMIGLGVIALHWTTVTAKIFSIIASLVVASVAGWVVHVTLEQPMTHWLKKRSAA